MDTIDVTVVKSPNCTHCAAFREFWEEIKSDWPKVQPREISITTPEGQALALQHMIMASPGVVINDELLSTGGVNKERFIAKLKELSGHE